MPSPTAKESHSVKQLLLLAGVPLVLKIAVLLLEGTQKEHQKGTFDKSLIYDVLPVEVRGLALSCIGSLNHQAHIDQYVE